MLAASLAQELVNSQHWTDAFWIDLQGVTNVVLAGQHLMAGLGLVSDVADTQQLLAWLEGRPRERFGIVLTHVQELVMAQAEEHQGFLDLLDNILHVSLGSGLTGASGRVGHSLGSVGASRVTTTPTLRVSALTPRRWPLPPSHCTHAVSHAVLAQAAGHPGV
jgi:hypothetical protein